MIRDVIHAGRDLVVSAASVYLRPAGGAEYGTTLGTPIMRDGSITGAACAANITSFASAGTLTLEVRKNDVVVFTATSPTIGANGVVSWSASQDEGIDLVSSAGPDLLQMRMTRDSGSFNYWPIANCKLILDHPDESFRTLLVASSGVDLLIGSSVFYMRFAGGTVATSTRGTRMPEGGSIVGIGMHGSCTLFFGSGDVRGQVRVNNVVVLETDPVTVTGLGPLSPSFKTQASGVDTFAAGDLLQVTFVPTTTFIVANAIIVVEIEFSTPVVVASDAIELAGGSVTSLEIAGGSVASTEQGAGSVASTEQAGGVVGSTEVGGGPVGASEI